MLVRNIPAELLWNLHVALGHELGPEIISCLEAKLEAELVVSLGVDGGATSIARLGSDCMTLILMGTDKSGGIGKWREWVIPETNRLASIAALRLRVESALMGARAFEAWADRAQEAALAGRPTPPRLLGPKYS